MPLKKVKIFIVEGTTDETSIGSIVKKLNKDKKIYFQIVNYDITSHNLSDTNNIKTKIWEQVRECIRKQHFLKSDILEIIHLVDMDGAYVKPDFVIYDDVEKIQYSLECIKTKNVDATIQRNEKKSRILNMLSSTKEINGITYNVYFCSCNLEHVLHDKQNVTDNEKSILADRFEDSFIENPEKFVEFINDEAFALKMEFKKTWEFIKQDTNSLKRYTNLNLLFEE